MIHNVARAIDGIVEPFTNIGRQEEKEFVIFSEGARDDYFFKY